jgi:plasmid stabilization system protein ParE
VTIYFAPEAEEDFAALVGYLLDRNPTAAADLGRRIFDVIDKLAAKQFEGTEQTLKTGELVRSWAVPPVRIYYQRQPSVFWVLRIYHHAREPISKP